jgi:hypothetical protein
MMGRYLHEEFVLLVFLSVRLRCSDVRVVVTRINSK